MENTTVWIEQDNDHGVWKCAACEADGPEENGFNYCPYCGRYITQHVHL